MTCESPLRPSGLLLALVFVFAACATPDNLVDGHAKDAHDRKLKEATEKSDDENLRMLCREPEIFEPPGIFALFLKKWENKAVQQQACTTLKQRYDAGLAQVNAKATGGACLANAQRFFAKHQHREGFTFEWEEEPARRAALAPVIEGCIGATEKHVADGAFDAAFADFLGHEKAAEAPVLTEPQRARVTAALKTTWAKVTERYEASAKVASASNPLAAALYLAGAAVVADSASDAAARDERLARARGFVKQAGDVSRLKVTLTGDALADRVKRAASSYSFVDKGEVAFTVKLSAPTTTFGQRDVTLNATRRVENGTKPAPEYTSMKQRCDALAHTIQQEDERCARFGGRDRNCSNVVLHRKDRTRCLERLGGIKATVKAFTDENIPYPGVEFYGRADGALELARLPHPARTLKVSGSVESVKHGPVPQVNLPAQNGGKVSQSAVVASYESQATQQVLSALRTESEALAKTLWEQAVAAQAADESASLLVRHALVASALPSEANLSPLDARLKVPTGRALALLLKKSSR